MPLQSIAVKLLRPTQIVVGQRLVKLKRKDLRGFERQPQELVDYIIAHPIRVVLGPSSQAYIIDHHHLACALLKEGFKTAPLQVEDDLSHLKPTDFWHELERRALVYPFNKFGKKKEISDIPSRLLEMENDPYRSLAGFVRMGGAFNKTLTPYVEFLWANYFRSLIKPKLLHVDFAKALRVGMHFAMDPRASNLPGFIGKALIQ